MQSPTDTDKADPEAAQDAGSPQGQPANPFERKSAWGRVVPDAPIQISRPSKTALDAAARRSVAPPRATVPLRPGSFAEPGLQLLSTPSPQASQRPTGLLTTPSLTAPKPAPSGILSGSALPPPQAQAPQPAPRPVPRLGAAPVVARPAVAPAAPPKAVAPAPARELDTAFASPLDLARPRAARPRRSSALLVAGGALVIAAGAGAALWLTSRPAPTPPPAALAVPAVTAAAAPSMPPPPAPATALAAPAPAPVTPPSAPVLRRTAQAAARPPAVRPPTAPAVQPPPPVVVFPEPLTPPPVAEPAAAAPAPTPVIRAPAPDPDAPMVTRDPSGGD